MQSREAQGRQAAAGLTVEPWSSGGTVLLPPGDIWEGLTVIGGCRKGPGRPGGRLSTVHGDSNRCHHSVLAVTDPRSPSADPELSGFVGHTSIE